jgi:hypothetical protein
MSTDSNGIRIKPDHSGVETLPYGEIVYLVVRCDDKMISVQPTRHDAIGKIATLDGGKEDWYDVVPAPVGSVRMNDVTQLKRL